MRKCEDNWLQVQARPLKQIKEIQAKNNNCPVFIAGDLFTSWNSQAELISWALVNLPDNCWAVPGNHDLPFHSYENINRSAFWTLVKAGKLNLLKPGQPVFTDSYAIHGFAHGVEVTEPKHHGLMYHIAVIHAYVWTKGHEHPGASKDTHVDTWWERLADLGYRVGAFGDNHKGFLDDHEQVTILNCGTLNRRTVDEVDYRPSIGLLHPHGKVSRHFLDVSKDKFIVTKKEDKVAKEQNAEGLSAAVAELSKEKSSIDFVSAVEHYIANNDLSEGVVNALVHSVESAYGRK